MNKRYLNHKTHTDIITFNYSSDDKLEAEFFVSFWAINKSAKEHSQTVENETLRVIIHGALHCMGYNDDDKEEIDNMRKMEDTFISMFHVKHNLMFDSNYDVIVVGGGMQERRCCSFSQSWL